MSETKVVIALLAGLAAGAALGILFAPETGTETRDKLTDSLTNLGESIKSFAAEQIDQLVNTFRNKVMNNVKEQITGEPAHVQPDDAEYAQY